MSTARSSSLLPTSRSTSTDATFDDVGGGARRNVMYQRNVDLDRRIARRLAQRNRTDHAPTASQDNSAARPREGRERERRETWARRSLAPARARANSRAETHAGSLVVATISSEVVSYFWLPDRRSHCRRDDGGQGLGLAIAAARASVCTAGSSAAAEPAAAEPAAAERAAAEPAASGPPPPTRRLLAEIKRASARARCQAGRAACGAAQMKKKKNRRTQKGRGPTERAAPRAADRSEKRERVRAHATCVCVCVCVHVRVCKRFPRAGASKNGYLHNVRAKRFGARNAFPERFHHRRRCHGERRSHDCL